MVSSNKSLGFTTTDYIILIGSFLLILIKIFLIVNNSPKILEKAVEKASHETEFGATYYEIYDKSEEDMCDRLIIVKPFEWMIWAKNGSIYILGDTNKQCPVNYTPASIVPNDIPKEVENSYYNFKSVCIHSIFNDIVNSYKNHVSPVKVPYIITDIQHDSGKFTIIDALNNLLLNYLTMTSPTDTSTMITNKSYTVVDVKLMDKHKIISNQKLISNLSVATLTAKQKYSLTKILNKRH